MHPLLFRIPLFGLFGRDFVPIYGYGVMVALAFLIASFWVQREARRQGEDPHKALDLIFYILIAAIVGSRLFHVLVSEREQFFTNPLHLFKIWEGGLVFYGGFIASSLIAIWYLKKHHLSLLKYFDFFAPAIALGHAIGRQGCFLAGCCHGSPLTNKTWYAVVFPDDPQSLAPPGIPLYPTQLMESAAEFLIFLILLFFLRRKRFDGQIISMYLMLYALARFLIEFLRGDFVRGFVWGGLLSTSQFIALILFAFGLCLYLYKRKCVSA